MKLKLLRRGLALAASGFLLLASPALRAHEGEDGERMLERMKGELALSDDQFDKVKTEANLDRDLSKPLAERIVLDMDSLKVLLDKKASDADLKPVIAKIKDDRAAMDAQRDAHMDALQQILTPLQQAKAILLMRGRMAQDRAAGDGPGSEKAKDAKP